MAEGGFAAQAVSRAYYAVFYAAQEALGALGETRSKHSGVIAAFGELAVRERGFDAATARVLRSLFRKRNEADYVLSPVPAETAGAAIEDAERFVDAVERWLDEREH